MVAGWPIRSPRHLLGHPICFLLESVAWRVDDQLGLDPEHALPVAVVAFASAERVVAARAFPLQQAIPDERRVAPRLQRNLPLNLLILLSTLRTRSLDR